MSGCGSKRRVRARGTGRTEGVRKIVSMSGVGGDGPASAPFDGEGTPRRRTPLVETGRLTTYLHDSYTARRAGNGQASTGNASRAGYRSAPSVSTSNLVIAEGESAADELIAAAGDGVYVTDVAGLHSGVNPVSGTFSVGASGRLIESGALAAPVSEFTIASALAGTDVLTVGATGAIAEHGACVGFELEEGRPRIYVNLRVAKAQKVDFRADLLRLVKLV